MGKVAILDRILFIANNMNILSVIVCILILASTSCQRRAILHEHILCVMNVGEQKQIKSIHTPKRISGDHDWGYMFSLVVNKSESKESGQINIFKSGNKIKEMKFSAENVIKSTWYSDDRKTAFLVKGNFKFENLSEYKIEVKFDKALEREVIVCIHYLDVQKRGESKIENLKTK